VSFRWELLIVECLLKTKASFTLMQLAASGEDHIESVMVKEPSFLAARTTRLLLKIRLSLSLLNQALQRKHLVLVSIENLAFNIGINIIKKKYMEFIGVCT